MTVEIDADSIRFAEDRKSVTFNLIRINATKSSTVPQIGVKLDVDSDTTSEQVTMTLTNVWEQTLKATANIPIDRPTVSVKLDNQAAKTLFSGYQDQEVLLQIAHNNAVRGPVDTRVTITLPDNVVTLLSAEVDASCRNTIDLESVVINENTISYTVTNYGTASTATDVLRLKLNVAVLEEPEENRSGSTITAAEENGTGALITQEASITVARPYFDVVLYGPQDAWIDMSRGDGSAWSVSRKIRFYGADDYTALMMHAWSFEEEPISGIYTADADGSVMIGPVVTNPNTNMQWTLVGFVPIQSMPDKIREDLYGSYYLEDLDACRALIEEKGGVPYGGTPSEEQAKSLAQYLNGSGQAKAVCVWYIQEPPKEVYTKYDYDESAEYVPKVHPAAYTETSDGIGVTIESGSVYSGSGVHPYNVTFTIPEDYDQDTITLNTEFNDAVKAVVRGFQPGDKLQWNIKVIDKSGRYGYLKDSGAVGTIDYYTAEHYDAYSVIGNGFEGYKIENADEKPGGHASPSRVTRRGNNFAIRRLAEISELDIAENPTDENVGRALYAIGYGAEGEGADRKPLAEYTGADGEPDYAKITRNLLDDYYLDYLNAAYYAQDAHKDEDSSVPHYTGFSDLSAADYRSLFNSDNGTQVMETNPVLVDAMYYGMYEQSILMSEQEDGIDNYRGTWSWMHDWNGATEGNAYEEVIYNQYEEHTTVKDDGTAEHDLSWYQWVTGTRNGNNMQDTYFGLAYQFKLVKKVKITKVAKDHKDSDHILTDAKFKLMRVDEQGEELTAEEQPLNLPYEVRVDENGAILFPALLPGRYKLEETTVPEGYGSEESTWYMNVDAAGEASFETPASLISHVETNGEERFNEFWIENIPAAELPATGGAGTARFAILGAALVLLAGAGLVYRRMRSAV